MRLLSFIVGALACFAPTAIAGRVGYEIGTAAGLDDVMSNGIAKPGWNGEVGANYFYPRTQSLKFVSRLNFTGIRPQPTIQTQGYSIRFEYSIPNVVQVSMDPLQQAGTLNVGSEQPIDMKFACLSSSGIKATMVTVITSFHDPPGDDSQFDFYKTCELPPINVGAYGPDGVRATVVQNGKPVDGFKFTVTPDEAASQFEMWLPIPLSQYYPYFNFSSPPQITWNHFAMPYLSWEISEPYILPQDVQPYTKLTINYNCDITMAASSTEISVIIDNGFASKLEFAFMKNCSYGAGQVLPNVFHVGSSDTGNDVIQGGTPIGNWGTNSGHVMPPNEHEIDLFAYINATTRVDGTSLPFSVVATVSNDNKVFILNEGSSAPRQFYANMSTVFPRTKIPMDITCISSGVASGTVVFSFGEIYRDVTVRFQYTCSKPYFDVNFMNSDASTVIAPVIVKNVQTWSYVSPQSSHKEVFQVKLSPNSPYAYDVQDITFDYVGYDSSVMKPQVLPTTGWMPATVNTPIYMQILFHCIQDMPVSTTPVMISIDYGWNEKTNITFQKTCPETDAPSSSSGWSAAGIFFFTVFILTLVGCLTGAGYKYTKEDKRGWEIIPGITYYRACYDKACPTKRYTPQTDYYHDNIPDHGGKSYQTEL